MHDRSKTYLGIKAKQLQGTQIQIQWPEMCLILETKQFAIKIVQNNLVFKL